MRNLLWLTVATFALSGGSLHAQGYFPGQPYNPGGRPAYSPYLNMLRPGGTATQNYFGLVRPQQNFMNDVQQLDQGQMQLGGQQNALANDILPATGHVSRFMTQNRYFMTNGSQGYGGGGFGGGGGGFGGGLGGGGFGGGGLGGNLQGLQGAQGTSAPRGR